MKLSTFLKWLRLYSATIIVIKGLKSTIIVVLQINANPPIQIVFSHKVLSYIQKTSIESLSSGNLLLFGK